MTYRCVVQGNWIDGRFQKPADPNGEWEARSPADHADVFGKIPYSYKAVDEAVGAATHSCKTWSRRSVADRAEGVRKFQKALERRAEEVSEILARETGVPLWEARVEIEASLRSMDSILKECAKLSGGFEIKSVFENTKGVCRTKPLGVIAVISSFSAPIYKPTEYLASALATGNAVVFKPSEKAPISGQLLAECAEEAGLPKGVVNLVQGEREVGRRLSVHEGVHGILFTGSYESGTRIQQDCLQQHWKCLVLEMGGKNPAIVWEDADLDFALKATFTGAFLTAGQRGTSTSRIFVHKKIFEEFKTRFHERAKAFVIGHPLSNPFMGPLIDAHSVDRYMKFLGIAQREGCEILMRGKSLELGGGLRGFYVAPSICLVKNISTSSTKKSTYQQTELLAPNVALAAFSDVEEAIAAANATQYGLAASVFTPNRGIYEKCLEELEFGLVHWNQPTVAIAPQLPCGGLKKSGNHRPSGIHTPLHCVKPISSLESVQSGPQKDQELPGLNWK